MEKKFKKYLEFINESLAFISMKGTMKNEFMNNIQLKSDFETARRLFYDNGSCLLTHISGEEFELRTFVKFEKSDFSNLINKINEPLVKFEFSISKVAKLDKSLKEWIWILKVKIK
jgi:hypothetical protein